MSKETPEDHGVPQVVIFVENSTLRGRRPEITAVFLCLLPRHARQITPACFSELLTCSRRSGRAYVSIARAFAQREGLRLSALDRRRSGIPERLSRWFVPHVKGAHSVQRGDGSWPGSLPKKAGARAPSGARWGDTATALTGRKCHEQTPCASSIPSLCLVSPSPASPLCVRCATQRRCAGPSATMGCSCAWA